MSRARVIRLYNTFTNEVSVTTVPRTRGGKSKHKYWCHDCGIGGRMATRLLEDRDDGYHIPMCDTHSNNRDPELYNFLRLEHINRSRLDDTRCIYKPGYICYFCYRDEIPRARRMAEYAFRSLGGVVYPVCGNHTRRAGHMRQVHYTFPMAEVSGGLAV